MGDDTKIEWTDATWNPVRGCTRVSSGCENCYAERVAARFSRPGEPYHGLARFNSKREPRWTGTVRMVPEHLGDPLRWKRPRRVFVNSMSDMFHEALTNEQIAAVFGVMAAAPQHQFQVLTKRAERMREWFEWVSREGVPWGECVLQASKMATSEVEIPMGRGNTVNAWPLPNVWLGVSCEDQQRADERIPLLLQCPAEIRWVSAEPLLGPIDFQDQRGWLEPFQDIDPALRRTPRLNWIVVGGESGPGARPSNVDWIRGVVRQCGEASVPVFVKQLGAYVTCDTLGHEVDGKWPKLNAEAIDDNPPRIKLRDRKGGDPSEWSPDLRVRQWPEVRR